MYNPQLETFIRVADAGSFNKAAEESYITPTVQRFLDAAKELRKELYGWQLYLQVYTAKQSETSLEVSFFL